MSIGDQISRQLANNETRELMQCRANYISEPDVYRDIFDGVQYQRMKNEKGLFEGDDDVAVALFIDGFKATRGVASSSLTLINLLNMNLDPCYW
jgi:hypothetical protein